MAICVCTILTTYVFTIAGVCGICAAREDVRQFVQGNADQPFKCPVCDDHVHERITVIIGTVNESDGYHERLRIVNDVLTCLLSEACKDCYMISPVSYPLISNPYDIDRYHAKSEDVLKRWVLKCVYKVLKVPC